MVSMLRWTPEQYDAFKAKAPQSHGRQAGKAAMQALGRLPAGRMNKTEEAYAQLLAAEKHSGKILWFEFEALKFRLADKTFYTPDFVVMTADANVEIHEVKGHWTDDARVKIKVAADKFPFRFIAIRKGKRGIWERELF